MRPTAQPTGSLVGRAPGKAEAIIEEARWRSRRRRTSFLFVSLVVAIAVATAYYVIHNRSGSPPDVQSQSASSGQKTCFGTERLDGDNPINGQTCDVVSAALLKRNIHSRADWYAVFTAALSDRPAAIRFGCEMPFSDARMYVKKFGPTFSIDTLRNFRAACKG